MRTQSVEMKVGKEHTYGDFSFRRIKFMSDIHPYSLMLDFHLIRAPSNGLIRSKLSNENRHRFAHIVKRLHEHLKAVSSDAGYESARFRFACRRDYDLALKRTREVILLEKLERE